MRQVGCQGRSSSRTPAASRHCSWCGSCAHCPPPPSWVDILVDLQVRYERGSLKIATKWENDPELPQLLMSILLKVWEWRRFSDSRWASLGASCRSLLAAFLLGLPDYVSDVLSTQGTTTYYLKGFQYMTAEVRALMGLIASSSFVTDSLLVELMEDDRLPLRYNELQQELLMEVEYVETLCICRCSPWLPTPVAGAPTPCGTRRGVAP